MLIKTNGSLGRAIAEYTGLRVLELDLIPDPVVAGTYAMQAILFDDPASTGFTQQFLVCDIPLRQVTEHDLEECEFTHWPPTSDQTAPSWPVPDEHGRNICTPQFQRSPAYKRYLGDVLDPRN
jgi:hypothetical protein